LTISIDERSYSELVEYAKEVSKKEIVRFNISDAVRRIVEDEASGKDHPNGEKKQLKDLEDSIVTLSFDDAVALRDELNEWIASTSRIRESGIKCEDSFIT
jgi:hypothetical protein